MTYFASAGELIVNTLFGLLMFVIVMRVLLQWVRANFYNPICQALYKLTNPILMPLQKIVPTVGGINLGGVLIAYVLALVWITARLALSGYTFGIDGLLVLGVAQLLEFTISVLFWTAIVSIVLSWVASDSPSPVVPLVFRVADIVLGPFRRVIPPLGGLDLSPIVALLALQLAQHLIVMPLYGLGAWLGR